VQPSSIQIASLDEVREAYVEAVECGWDSAGFWKITLLERLLNVADGIEQAPSGIAGGESARGSGSL
jgi:hypothetical protein